MAGGERTFTSVEICAGAGGQAIGLENAGFRHLALVEIDRFACATLEANAKRMGWDGRIFKGDVRDFDPAAYDIEPGTIDLLAGGVPCPPFSLAGKQLGREDERDLFPVMLDLVAELQPKAVMIENVRGLLQDKFTEYRQHILDELTSEKLGYVPVFWDLLNASDFGVSQLRPRSILVALKPQYADYFPTPKPLTTADSVDGMLPGLEAGRASARTKTVGQVLRASMVARGMSTADAALWAKKANRVAPTLVGGSKKHGGADLGPTRAKRQWEQMGVDGHGVADDDEPATLDGPYGRGPRLTVKQAARLQGFDSKWIFAGGKTAQYRQVGNAFPPPVAEAVARWIIQALEAAALEQGPPPKGRPAPGGALLPRPRSAPRKRPAPDAPNTEEQTSLPLPADCP